MNYFTDPLDNADEAYEIFDLKVDDGKLATMFSRSLEESTSHWNQWPYCLNQNDQENIRYFLGQQMGDPYVSERGLALPNMGNHILKDSRAVLAYINARIANPEIAPSNDEKGSKQFAKDIRAYMYQHGIDHDLEEKVGKCALNLIIQKRAFLKLRFDPTSGPFGDIEVDHVAPENIVIDKWATYKGEPQRIFQKQGCTLEELILKFPAKKDDIYRQFKMKRGVYTQLSQHVTWWETWFTYYEEAMRKEGVAWYLPTGKLVLGKMENPNFIYTGDPQKDRIINFSPFPIKPFVGFNYLNMGKSYIDETSLFEQSKVLQDLYNKRQKQRMENNDYINGRSVADASALSEADANKFYSKGPKAILLIKPQQGQTVSSSFVNVPHNPLPDQITEEAYDTRDQIDDMMGAPKVFRGQESKNTTLGQDTQNIQQAGALQDDLARSIDYAMQNYYRKLFQMLKVYYTEDHWVQVKGDNGKYDHIVMNSDSIDTNVKISVEGGSTLPANKREIHTIAVDAANANKIDDLSFWEAIQYGKLPDPETIVTRMQKQTNDPASYISDVEEEQFNREAAVDIAMLIAGKEPPDRDEYGQAYIEYFNNFIMRPRYLKLTESNPDAQERIKVHLAMVGMMAARTANLGVTQVDDATQAGMTEENVAAMEQ